MENLRRICIIHTRKDKVLAIYFREFMKFIGLSYFDFTFNDQDDELNNVFSDGNNLFDIILYINPEPDWRSRFDLFGRIHITAGRERSAEADHCAVKSCDIWEGGENGSNLSPNLLSALLEKICENPAADMSKECREIWNILIDLYCSQDVLHLLFNNQYTVCMANCASPLRDMHDQRYLQQYIRWIRTIEILEKINSDCVKRKMNSGREYLEYSVMYCMRKANELCDILQATKTFDTRKLLRRAQKLSLFDKEFSTVSNLQAKIARIDDSCEVKAISLFKDSVLKCRVDLCCSFELYQLGKQYEVCGYREKAVNAFNKSYKKNTLNFRAVFKLAVDQMGRRDSLGARKSLETVLRILQLNGDENIFKETVRYLPPLELEYACKCYILLGTIEQNSHNNYVNASMHYKKALLVHDCISGNQILKDIYSPEDCEYMTKCLNSRLSRGSIEKKLEYSQKIDMYRNWRKDYGGK